MTSPVSTALSGSPQLQARYEAFRSAAFTALDDDLLAQITHAVSKVHGIDAPAPDGNAPDGNAPVATLAYARRIPFEHTAISDEEAAAVVAELGEAGFVAFSVVISLIDAECRATKLKLEELAA